MLLYKDRYRPTPAHSKLRSTPGYFGFNRENTHRFLEEQEDCDEKRNISEHHYFIAILYCIYVRLYEGQVRVAYKG